MRLVQRALVVQCSLLRKITRSKLLIPRKVVHLIVVDERSLGQRAHGRRFRFFIRLCLFVVIRQFCLCFVAVGVVASSLLRYRDACGHTLESTDLSADRFSHLDRLFAEFDLDVLASALLRSIVACTLRRVRFLEAVDDKKIHFILNAF